MYIFISRFSFELYFCYPRQGGFVLCFYVRVWLGLRLSGDTAKLRVGGYMLPGVCL